MKRLDPVPWGAGLVLLALLGFAWHAYQQDAALQLWLLGASWCG